MDLGACTISSLSMSPLNSLDPDCNSIREVVGKNGTDNEEGLRGTESARVHDRSKERRGLKSNFLEGSFYCKSASRSSERLVRFECSLSDGCGRSVEEISRNVYIRTGPSWLCPLQKSLRSHAYRRPPQRCSENPLECEGPGHAQNPVAPDSRG